MVQSEQGELTLAIPPARQGPFESVLVPKHQGRLSGLDEKILALYARGMSTRDIAWQLEELYVAQLSPAIISEVTDTVSEDVKGWQCRPLDELYPTVDLDALYVNIKVTGWLSQRAIYVVLGLNREGNRRVIYTTTALESVNRSLRKMIRIKAVFPDEDSVFKLMYRAMNNISKRWNRPIKNWRAALSHFAILFPERFKV